MLRQTFARALVFACLFLSCSKEQSTEPIIKADDKAQLMTKPQMAETCTDWYWVTWDGNGNIIGREYINTECTSGGGSVTNTDQPMPPGGGGAYSSGNHVAPKAKNGLSCHVFNYTPTASNWQECGVSHMRYKLFWLGGPNSGMQISITLNAPVVFGMPLKRADGKIYGPGYAAQMSAEATNFAGAMVTQLLKSAPIQPSEYEIEKLYREQLSNFMKNYGGTATRTGGGSGSIIFAEADYNLFGNGDCDDSKLL